tara:strand:- start:33 stop:251 length:219 start_codon:yes stop_codon:yes gene_type:complete
MNLNVSTEALLQAILIVTALGLFWLIIRRNSSTSVDEQDEYSGSARDPRSLSEPTPEALSELDRLIEEKSDH